MLALHSFRHTWKTVARRAGVADDRLRVLGGWPWSAQSTSQVWRIGSAGVFNWEVMGPSSPFFF